MPVVDSFPTLVIAVELRRDEIANGWDGGDGETLIRPGFRSLADLGSKTPPAYKGWSLRLGLDGVASLHGFGAALGTFSPTSDELAALKAAELVGVYCGDRFQWSAATFERLRAESSDDDIWVAAAAVSYTED